MNRDSYKVLGNPLELGEEEHSNASGWASQDCVHDCQGNNATVSILRYAALHMNWWHSKLNSKWHLGSSVEGKETKNKDEPSKSSKRHRVTRDVYWLPIYKPWNSEAFGQDDKQVWTINCPIQLCSLIEAFDQDDKKCGHLIVQFNCVPWLWHLEFGCDDKKIVCNRQLNCVLWQI